MPRRSGLVNATDPMDGDAGFTAVLTGKNFRAPAAAAIKMIDAVIPAGTDVDAFAERYVRETLPTLNARRRPTSRTPRA
jgi:enoyl-CoA hydratase/carnithine racemase